jgi:cardiolipin synthase
MDIKTFFRQFSQPANIVTLSRVPLAVAIVLLFDNMILALVLLAAAAVTDLLDGYLARRVGTTRFGAVLDSVCDKLFFLILIIFLIATYRLALFHAALILLRDVAMALIVLVFAFHTKKHALKQKLEAKWAGKVVTVAQFAALLWLFLGIDYFSIIVYAVALLSLMAIADYAAVVKKELGK